MQAASYLCVTLLFACTAVRVHAQTTIYIVRHAEKKSDPGNPNPPLSERGTQRAALLAKMLRSVPIDAVHSTRLERTRRTVEPAAAAANVPITEYASELALADQLKAGRAGRCVLVAGHSNSIPPLLAALGVKDKVDLLDDEFDNLFIVVIATNGDIVCQRLRYGVELPP